MRVVISPPTNQEILELGLATCVDGACLALKSFVGHSQALVRQGVNMLFAPQIISVYRKEYTCPGFLGLPDLVRQYIPRTVQLESPTLDARKGEMGFVKGYWQLGRKYSSWSRVRKAWKIAIEAQHDFELKQWQRLQSGFDRSLNILLLGPRYLTDDAYLNGNIINHLEKLGAEVVTAWWLPDSITFAASSVLKKRPFWTGTRRSIGALEHLMNSLDGVINISPFGCGAESMLSILVGHRIGGERMAHLELNIDEHTSEVGLITRLEAFCDLLERKKSG